MILKRIPSSRFSEIIPEWSGEMVAIIGGGSSLRFDQVDKIELAHKNKKMKCIAVNDSYLLAPWADVCYAADLHWHRWHTEGIAVPALNLNAEQVSKRWADFKGLKCSIKNNSGEHKDENVHVLKNFHGSVHGFGLSNNKEALVTGRNSGFQALNLAVLAGAKKILLLGFDGSDGIDGKTHWFGQHQHRTNPAVYDYYRRAMSMAENELDELGVKVFNCSLNSQINSFPKILLDELL